MFKERNIIAEDGFVTHIMEETSSNDTIAKIDKVVEICGCNFTDKNLRM
jgi:hypothetical protein